MSHLTSLNIETLALNISSEPSIANCASKIRSLDMLVNNAGATMTTAVTDTSIAQAKSLFDTNL